MSWNIEFIAKNAAEAISCVQDNNQIPDPIKDYICRGLNNLPENKPVQVKGFGHLFTGEDYDETTVTLSVKPFDWAT